MYCTSFQNLSRRLNTIFICAANADSSCLHSEHISNLLAIRILLMTSGWLMTTPSAKHQFTDNLPPINEIIRRLNLNGVQKRPQRGPAWSHCRLLLFLLQRFSELCPPICSPRRQALTFHPLPQSSSGNRQATSNQGLFDRWALRHIWRSAAVFRLPHWLRPVAEQHLSESTSS